MKTIRKRAISPLVWDMRPLTGLLSGLWLYQDTGMRTQDETPPFGDVIMNLTLF